VVKEMEKVSRESRWRSLVTRVDLPEPDGAETM
jgi:hypothetical protein